MWGCPMNERQSEPAMGLCRDSDSPDIYPGTRTENEGADRDDTGKDCPVKSFGCVGRPPRWGKVSGRPRLASNTSSPAQHVLSARQLSWSFVL